MTKVELTATGAQAQCSCTGLLTAGMVGVTATFALDSAWDGLQVTALFRTAGITRDVPLTDSRETAVPFEVLQSPGCTLYIGVEGHTREGDLVIPSTWAEAGKIQPGAHLSGNPAVEPTPSQYDRIMAALAQVKDMLPADWNAGPGQTGHILGRTHWVESGGVTTLLPETTLTAGDDGLLYLPVGLALVAEETYTVVWNGASYTCTGMAFVEDGITGVLLGNVGGYIGSGPDTGEPFLMLSCPAAYEPLGFSGIAGDLTGLQTVTFSVTQSVAGQVHKLDNRFLDLDWLPVLAPMALMEPVTFSGQTAFDIPGVDNTTLSQGDALVVEWDGVRYRQTVRYHSYYDLYYVGNGGILDASLDNTGEPFLLALFGTVNVFAGDEAQHTITLYALQPDPMPAAFLPEGVLQLDKPLTDAQQAQARELLGAAAADTVRYSAQTLTDAQKQQARENIGAAPAQTVTQEPEDGDLPVFFLDAPMAESPAEVATAFHYRSKTADVRGHCYLRTWGSKTLKNPKKDQRLRLYVDENYTTALNPAFRNWKAASRYLLRANWFDMSHSRAIVAARLWPEMQRSRSDFQRLPAAYRQLPLLGGFDGFPVRVFAAGDYQGRFTLNTLPDPALMGLDAANTKHCMLTCEAGMSAWFRSAALFDGTDWTDELRETLPTALADRWNSAIALVQSGTDVNFKSRLSEYFYVPALIDYYLFSLLTGTRNAFDGDQVFLCYDGLHFLPALWDLSDAWGLGEDSFLPPQFPRERYDDQENGYGNLLYQRLEEQFAADIRTRWEQLKAGALSVENIVCRMEEFGAICPPHVAADDYAETTAGGSCTEIPLKAENHLGQMRAFVCNRTAFLDTYLATLGQERTLYALTEETVFDGQSDYLDTGLALSAEDKDFTIVLECHLDGTQPMTDGRAVLLGNYNADDQSGLVLAADTAHYSYTLCANGVVDNTTIVPRAGNGRLRAVIAHSAGTDLVTVRMGWGGSVVDGSRNGMTGAWKSSNRPLVLGACLDENGNASNFWHGTITSLRVSRQLPNWSYYNTWLREANSV